LCSVISALIRTVSLPLSLACLSYTCLPSLLLARLWTALPLAPLPLPDPHPLPCWSGQGSVLSDWFPYLKAFPHVQLTDRPDDGGSKYL
jgi:hypothetical protein